MANHPSAEKRNRQNIVRRERNRKQRAFMRSRIKNIRALIAEGKAEEAKALLPKVISAIEKVGSKGVLHKNAVSRKVSRTVRAVNKLLQKQPSTG
ncbi:MAG: 30S ribosomal protein S20 [Myxococcota bacterium]